MVCSDWSDSPIKFQTHTKFFLWYPDFSSHHCKASDSVPPCSVPPGSFCTTNSTTSYTISMGIKTGVCSYDSNVEQWGLLSYGFFPSMTSATVLYVLKPTLLVARLSVSNNPPVSRLKTNKTDSHNFPRRTMFEKVR